MFFEIFSKIFQNTLLLASLRQTVVQYSPVKMDFLPRFTSLCDDSIASYSYYFTKKILPSTFDPIWHFNKASCLWKKTDWYIPSYLPITKICYVSDVPIQIFDLKYQKFTKKLFKNHLHSDTLLTQIVIGSSQMDPHCSYQVNGSYNYSKLV